MNESEKWMKNKWNELISSNLLNNWSKTQENLEKILMKAIYKQFGIPNTNSFASNEISL